MNFVGPLASDNWPTEESIEAYNHYLDQLGESAGVSIKTLDDLLEAIEKRHTFFHENGCRLSDHGFYRFECIDEPDEAEDEFLLLRQRDLKRATLPLTLPTIILKHIAKLNAKRGWTMQLHLGAIRNNNSRMYGQIGPDAGFDSMGNATSAVDLSCFFDLLEKTGELPKTIVYNLNPADNAMLATMIGNFQNGNCHPRNTPGKMQFGSGWWFLDQKDGMEQQLDTLSNLGLLSTFVGMLTDSRSFLSYTRHEYFRRILCNLLGTEMEQGLLPNDLDLIGNMVQNICYNNASRYFGFEL